MTDIQDRKDATARLANEEEAEAGRLKRPADLDQEWRQTTGAKIGWSVEAFLWDWVFWNPMKSLPMEAASNAASALLRRLGPLSAPHRTMVRNLRLVFPNWSETQVKEVADGAWDNLGRIAGEMPHLPRIKAYTKNARIEVIGAEHLDHVRESRKGIVGVSGHLANWEAMVISIVNRPIDCHITYRPANNPLIDKRINKARLDYGVSVLTPKGAGTRDLMRALARGQSVFLMNDQKFNQGIPVKFFGHDAMTAPGPTRLAKRFKTKLMVVDCRRLGPARYRVTIHEPFAPEQGPDEEAAIAATVLKINKFVEARILEAPEQWFWMHNRWPKEAWVKAGVM
jgi:Kdo2-lipid IVA lauroyltransferase/acyltransferase